MPIVIFVAKTCKYGIFVAKIYKYGIFVAKIYKYALIDSFQESAGSLDSAASCAALFNELRHALKIDEPLQVLIDDDDDNVNEYLQRFL